MRWKTHGTRNAAIVEALTRPPSASAEPGRSPRSSIAVDQRRSAKPTRPMKPKVGPGCGVDRTLDAEGDAQADLVDETAARGRRRRPPAATAAPPAPSTAPLRVIDGGSGVRRGPQRIDGDGDGQLQRRRQLGAARCLQLAHAEVSAIGGAHLDAPAHAVAHGANADDEARRAAVVHGVPRIVAELPGHRRAHRLRRVGQPAPSGA